MKKSICLLMLFILGCSVQTPEIKPPDKNPISSSKPSESPTPIPTPTIEPIKKIEVKDVFAFPENMVLVKDDIKEIFAKVKTQDNKLIDDYIITSSDSSITEIKNNSIKALKEGTVKLTVSSKSEPSKIKILNLKVQSKKIEVKSRLEKALNENITSKRVYIYNRFIDIYKDNQLKKSIKINDFPYERDESYQGDGGITDDYANPLKTLIDIDENNNISVLYLNAYKDYRVKSFDSEGNSIFPTISIYEANESSNLNYFDFDVSNNGENIIFYKHGYTDIYNQEVNIRIYSKTNRKIYEKNLTRSTKDTNSSNLFYSGKVSINNSGEYIISWLKLAGTGYNFNLLKYSINNDFEHDYNSYIGKSEELFNIKEISNIHINDDSDINLSWIKHRYIEGKKDFPNKKTILGLKNQSHIILNSNDTYKAPENYSKCISSNEKVISIDKTNFLAKELGTATVTCFDEKDYEKNTSLTFNVGF
ncbi:MAG: hypothetical protein U0354_05295 [Candidatus Sericytochromatia bacterium]